MSGIADKMTSGIDLLFIGERCARALLRGLLVAILITSIWGCGEEHPADGTEQRQLAVDHEPHYDFENAYEPGYCAVYADPSETGGVLRPIIDTHGLSFTPERRRPTWTQISQGRHYFDAPRTTGYDDEGERIINPNGALRVPDYRLISNNFNVLNSLTLLLSSLTKITDTIQDIDENGIGSYAMQYVDEAICSGFGDEIGHCICASPGSSVPCDGAFNNAQDVINDVGQAFNGLPEAASAAFQSVAQDFINKLINGEPNHTPGVRQALLYLIALTGLNPNPSAISAPAWLEVSLDPQTLADYNGITFPDGGSLTGPPDALNVQIQDVATQWVSDLEGSVDALMDAYEAAFSTQDPNFVCSDAVTALNDFTTSSTSLANTLAALPNTIVAAYNQVLATWQDVVTLIKDFWEDLKTLWGNVKQLWTAVSDAIDVDGIGQVNWSAFSDDIQGVITSATALYAHVQAVEAMITDIENLVTELMNTATEIQTLATGTLANAEALSDALNDCADTFQTFSIGTSSCGLPQVTGIVSIEDATADLCSYLSVDLNDPNSLAGRVYSQLEQEWQRVIYLLELSVNGFLAHFDGNGVATLVDDLLSALLTNFFTGVASDILDCHTKDTRCNCTLYCESKSQEVYIWLPVDYATNPGATAGAAGYFALEQTGFLDVVVGIISDLLEDYLGDAVSFAADALGGITEVVERVLQFFSDAFRYIDQFSSGYHIGAYSDLRPDLHMCVSWAGHAAYAKFGGGGSDGNFSIGARYGHHQLSKRHRVRFGSGGFAAQFRDHQLALAPSLGIYKHIDGFKLWSQQRPLGLNLGNSSFNGDFTRANDLADIFHLTTPDDGTGGGQLFEAAMANGFGATLVRDLYPVQPAYSSGTPVPRPPGAGVWPRLPDEWDSNSGGWSYATSAPPWDTTPDWEQESDAVVSLGLNMGFDFGEEEWSLPEIPVFSTGVFEATLRLFFRLGMGIGWWHDTDRFLERIIANVNQNLPEGFEAPQLHYPADFARNMHAMQAPDVTAENGTFVYATPTIGGEISAKATFRIIELALRVSLSLGIKIQPGASAGLMDLNAALAHVLQNSNPPEEAECSPVIGEVFNSYCTASRYKACASTNDCPTGSACVSVPGSGDKVCSPICTANIGCAYGTCEFSASAWDEAGEAAEHQGGICSVPHADSLAYTDNFAETNCNIPESGGSCGISFFYETSMNQPMLFCIDDWLEVDEVTCTALQGYVQQYEAGLITLQDLIGQMEDIEQLGFITSSLSGLLGFVGSTPDPTPNCTMPDGTVLENYLGVCCLANGTCIDETVGACCHLSGDTDTCLATIADKCDDLINQNGGGVFRPGLTCSDLDKDCLTSVVPNFSLHVVPSGQPCGERNDPFDHTPYTTSYINVGEVSTCEMRGACVVEARDGSEIVLVVHGMNAAQCNDPNNSHFEGIAPELPRRYLPYRCVEEAVVDDNAVIGWSGDGCHPLQHGFPSACSCSSDDACMPGETCLIGTHEPTGEPMLSGRCVMAGSEEVFSCAADDGQCPNGRIFVSGSCAVPCTGPGTCETGRVCRQVDGAAPNTLACHPPHTVVYAESVAWGMDNVTAPMHSVWTYSMADYLQVLLFGLGFKLEIQLPFPRKPIKIIDLHKVWDIGSTWKGWLQPGLQAHYQHECSLDADTAIPGGNDEHLYDFNLSPMTNYQPYRGNNSIGSINPDQALDPDGLGGDLLCMGPGTGGPGVCRYRGDLDPNTALGNPATVGHGNTQRSVGTFLDWCKDILPDQAEFDVQAQDPTDLMQSLADAMNWSYDLSIDLFQELDVCIGDVPLFDYIGNLFETDGQGPEGMTITNETTGEETFVDGMPNFYTAPCEYVGQHTDRCPNGDCTFPCGEMQEFAAEIWGCMDWDMNYWLHQMILSLAGNTQILSLMSNPGWANSFYGSEGFPVATTAMINPANPSILRPSMLNPNVNILDFDAIFMKGATGAYPLSLSDMIGTFRDLDYFLTNPPYTVYQASSLSHFPPIRAHNIGRLWHQDFATCMDENANDQREFGCSCTSHAECGEIEPGSYCEFNSDPAPGVGVCWKNQPTRLSDDCDGDSGTPCTIVCSSTGQPPAPGTECPDYFFFPECTPFKLVLDGDVELCGDDDDDDEPVDDEPGDDPDPTSGACCTSRAQFAPCVEVEHSDSCDAIGGSFHLGGSCAEVDLCEPSPVFGACCLPNGYCEDNVTEEACVGKAGTFSPGIDCEDCLCEPEDIRPDPTPVDCGGCSTGGSSSGMANTLLLAFLLLVLLKGRRLASDRRLHRLVGVTLLAFGLTACADDESHAAPSGDESTATMTYAMQAAACCLDGACAGNLSSQECEAAGGVRQEGLTCQDPGVCGSGACCLPDGGCLDATPGPRCDDLGGTWTQDGVCGQGVVCAGPPPTPIGACCVQGQSCNILSDVECAAAQGVFHNRLSCDEVNHCIEPEPEGACCLDGQCEWLMERVCERHGGEFHLDQSCDQINHCIEPEPRGACCLEGECNSTLERVCARQGGTFYLDQSCEEVAGICSGDAAETGACCAEGGCIPDLSAARCEALGAEWHAGQACDQDSTCPSEVPTGACCTADGCIAGSTAARCEFLGGVYSEGQPCGPQTCDLVDEDPTGACCTDGVYRVLGTGRGFGCALTSGGAPVCFGPSAQQMVVPPGPYIDLAVTGAHACARTASGVVDCWRTNGAAFTVLAPPLTSMYLSGSTGCGVTMSGSLSCWDNFGNVVAPGGPTGPWQAVRLDGAEICALRTNGTVACWGGTTIDGAPLGAATWTEIAVIRGAVCGRDATGSVTCANFTGSACNPGAHPGPLTQIDAFSTCSICGLDGSDELECFGDTNTALSSGPVVQWDGFNTYLCVLRPDHTVNCYTYELDGLVVSDIEPPAGGGCTDNIHASHCGGAFHAGSSCDEINVCEDLPVGSCCTNDTCHDVMTQSACDAMQGVWAEGLPCLPDNSCPTPPKGACCGPGSGICTNNLNGSECTAQGGTFTAGVSCEEIDECRSPTGACCTSTDCFDNVTASLCEGLGGLFNTATTCNADDLSCPLPRGACCIEETGECLNDQLERECDAAGGVFYAELTCGLCDCSPTINPTVDAAAQDRNDGGCTTTGTTTQPFLLAGLLFAVGLVWRRRRNAP